MGWDEKHKADSGGDRIIINFAKRWLMKGVDVTFITTHMGQKHLEFYGIRPQAIHAYPPRGKSGIFIELMKLISGFYFALRYRPSAFPIIYSSSNFLSDILPGLMLKMRWKEKITWVVGFWMFPPNPVSAQSPYKGLSWMLRGFLYYVNAQIPFLLYHGLVDGFFVTNGLDKQELVNKHGIDPSRILVVRGGVDAGACMPPKEKRYDTVFVGRFHPQKGVQLLVDIWKKVCEKRPAAKLAMIGDGPLYDQVKKRVEMLSLQNNIELLGFMDGADKMRIFAESKVFVHPVIYDSGGMAPAEAMVCGLPLVTTDLPSIREYYPMGCLRVQPGSVKAFASTILRLLDDEELYERLSREAKAYCETWDWREKAEEAYVFLRVLAK
jgi:glycosyltransferase involved in cell wall biosynthesis